LDSFLDRLAARISDALDVKIFWFHICRAYSGFR
jgi:hypothetical protein